MSLKTVAAIAGGLLALAALSEKEKCGAKALRRYFNRLHENIKLSNVDENALLREKREVLTQDLLKYLPDSLRWSFFNQGSYAMGTGIQPYDGNFDIDIGIVFEFTRQDFPDPVELKKLVAKALSRGNRTVVIRRPCVTVHYMKRGQVDFHVDLAVYVQRPSSESLDLAMGRANSSLGNRLWSEQDPIGLIDAINNRYRKAEAEQFRRCVRYLKCWRDEQFQNGGAPLSVALTCAAYAWFEPESEGVFESVYVDAKALRRLVNSMLVNLLGRPEIRLPVSPHTNLLEKMTANQMRSFMEKLTELRDALDTAMEMPLENISQAEEILEAQFGV